MLNDSYEREGGGTFVEPEVAPPTPQGLEAAADDEERYYSYSYSESSAPVRSPRGSAFRNTARRRQLEMAEKLRTMDEKTKELHNRAVAEDNIDGLPDPVYDELRDLLVEERRQKVSAHKLLESEVLTTAIKLVDETQLYERKMKLQEDAYGNYDKQVAQVNEEMWVFDEKTRRMEFDLVRKLDVQRKRLLESHDYGLDDHEARWTADAKVRQYSHASTRLVFLRGQFKWLMTQCRFKEAEDVRRIIERTEQAEQELAFTCMQRDYEESLAKVKVKQQGELDFFNTHAEIQLKQLRQARAMERVTLVNKQRKVDEYERRISDPDKLWNQHQAARVNELVAKRGSRSPTGMITKMSRADITVRTEKEENIISLPPLNLRREKR
jgi:hypothetical protein